MRQGARYNDEARQHGTTRGRDNATSRQRNDSMTTRREGRRETQRSAMTWRGDATGQEVTTRGREMTQQPQTNKAGVTCGNDAARGEEDMTRGDGDGR